MRHFLCKSTLNSVSANYLGEGLGHRLRTEVRTNSGGHLKHDALYETINLLNKLALLGSLYRVQSQLLKQIFSNQKFSHLDADLVQNLIELVDSRASHPEH